MKLIIFDALFAGLRITLHKRLVKRIVIIIFFIFRIPLLLSVRLFSIQFSRYNACSPNRGIQSRAIMKMCNNKL